jgi:DNA invertase Pin-like site-specific DNA recombinase
MPHAKRKAAASEGTAIAVGPAVAYVRMSTEHQQYSIANQLAVINEYAREHSWSVVRVYADQGISGLRADNRPALRELIAAAVKGSPVISKILVYDVSRWGRFQDTDQSAFYEYLCRLHDIEVIYCAETFANDRTPMSAVMKSVKRVMAAEYSRELSVRVHRGLRYIAQLGFDQGGGPLYGFKHILVDASGKPVKNQRARSKVRLRKHHVKLAPGAPNEIRLVRSVFRRFVTLHDTTHQIAKHLNAQGHRTRKGNPWRAVNIQAMLGNEKYIGTQTFNLTTGPLKSKRRKAPQADWIRVPRAFPGIVSPALFEAAQRLYRQRRTSKTDDELLDALRKIRKKHGAVSDRLIRQEGGAPRSCTYQKRFGSLVRACQLIGYDGAGHWAHFGAEIKMGVVDQVREQVASYGETVRANSIFTRFWVSDRLCCALFLVRWRQGGRWRIKLNPQRMALFYLLVRLDEDDATILDYYVIPAGYVRREQTYLRLGEGRGVDRFKVPDLATACWTICKRALPTLPSPKVLRLSSPR